MGGLRSCDSCLGSFHFLFLLKDPWRKLQVSAFIGTEQVSGGLRPPEQPQGHEGLQGHEGPSQDVTWMVAKPSFSNESIAQGPNLLASLPKRTAMIATITTCNGFRNWYAARLIMSTVKLWSHQKTLTGGAEVQSVPIQRPKTKGPSFSSGFGEDHESRPVNCSESLTCQLGSLVSEGTGCWKCPSCFFFISNHSVLLFVLDF